MKYIWEKDNWTDFRFNSGELIARLGQARLCQGKIINNVYALGLVLNKEAQAEILVEEALKTAAIEGQILNKDSVRSSVARRLGLNSAGLLRPDQQTEGLVEVLLDATMHYDKPLTAKRLKSWQASLFPTGFSGLNRIRTGKWRGSAPMQVVSGPIGREKVHFQAPPYEKIPYEINKFISWWGKSQRTVEGLLRAGIAHFYFVTIHPFEDGNGRIARALTEMALAQDERLSTRFYSLSSKIMEERSEYYTILEKCQKGDGDITLWLSWFLECFERAVQHSEILIERILIKAQFWQRHVLTAMNDRQRKVVNRLLDAGQGKLEGKMTTRKYVAIAKVSRATAYREISDLLNKGVLLQNQGTGRNISYDLIWGNNGR